MIIGKRINDRYKVLEFIGGGGMSTVYLAHDVILNRDVAIKVLRYDSNNKEEYHRRFQREVLSATSLTHPNIVNIYDVGEENDMLYIVMEYVKGKTLKQYINEFAPLSPARAVHIMKQLTSAISHAHENQIIHRDIKPQNILVDQEGNVKVTDFGIATMLSATTLTKTNSVLGTVHYLSPEQARGGTATKKSDIYALGIVLYELLTGELPFSGESAVSIALKHLQSETPSVRNFDASIPQALENVILKATAKDPIHRYESVEEMEIDLETVLSSSRANEPKFVPPVDDEATKAIPIIKEPLPVADIANTKELTPSKTEEKNSPRKVKNGKQLPKQKKKNKKKLWTIVGISAAVLIFIIFLISILTPNKIEIPDVSNMEVDEAIEKLEDAGFKVKDEHKEEYSDEIEEGLVIGTDPKAGFRREKGTELTLIVSLGNEKIEMDDYVGKGIEQVQAALENSRFKEVVIEEKHSDKEKGIIIEQTPSAGEQVVPEETIVTLTVSKGRELKNVADLKGFNQAALNQYAQSSGFKIVVKSEEYSDDVPKGSVISQTPSANSQLEVGGTIEVVISKGPQEKPVKMYFKDILIPYEPVVMGEQQLVRIFIQDKTNTMAEPYEEIYITSNYTYRIQLEIEEGSKAAYRIERDSIVIAEETIPYNKIQ